MKKQLLPKKDVIFGFLKILFAAQQGGRWHAVFIQNRVFGLNNLALKGLSYH